MPGSIRASLSPEKSPLAKFRARRLRNPEGLKCIGLASESWRSPPPILNAAALSQVSPPVFPIVPVPAKSAASPDELDRGYRAKLDRLGLGCRRGGMR